MIPRLGRARHPRPALKRGPKVIRLEASGGGLANRMYPTQLRERSLHSHKSWRPFKPNGLAVAFMRRHRKDRARLTQVSLARLETLAESGRVTLGHRIGDAGGGQSKRSE